MKFNWVTRCFNITAMSFLVFSSSALPAIVTIVDLNSFGGSDSTARSINNAGDITGAAATVGNAALHAFLYVSDLHKKIDINTVGGSRSEGNSINSHQQIVGIYLNSKGVRASFLYSEGVMSPLQFPGGGDAVAINDAGHILGSRTFPDGPRAFIFRDGTEIPLGTLGGAMAIAMALNNKDQVTGESLTSTQRTPTHAFLYTGGKIVDIQTANVTFILSAGTALNDAGEVTGWGDKSNSIRHLILYSGGQMQDLGAPSGDYAVGFSINNLGQIVGVASWKGDHGVAMYYSKQTGFVDLNSFLPAGSGWKLFGAFGINDHGQVVGMGTINGQQHGFLMNGITLDAKPPVAMK
jgi:probable HAF family extracellular repeat protein